MSTTKQDSEAPFWETKSLVEMNTQEWESLCDRCGLCCLVKAEDEERGDIYLTSLICPFYDLSCQACGCYDQRKIQNPECSTITPLTVQHYDWLPDHCAYRLLASGKPLASWHPLKSGTVDTVVNVVNYFKGVKIRHLQPHSNLEDHLILD
ncbi:YcgN family cysteine cluster protein [Magnetococcus sp. PR-3]|uniref:YcgN family cysteine cluster protein n=1 Tax=Magnetococcus sp. PR-3 TaxID=3120355 RepID=UPI002FCE247B